MTEKLGREWKFEFFYIFLYYLGIRRSKNYAFLSFWLFKIGFSLQFQFLVLLSLLLFFDEFSWLVLPQIKGCSIPTWFTNPWSRKKTMLLSDMALADCLYFKDWWNSYGLRDSLPQQESTWNCKVYIHSKHGKKPRKLQPKKTKLENVALDLNFIWNWKTKLIFFEFGPNHS